MALACLETKLQNDTRYVIDYSFFILLPCLTRLSHHTLNSWLCVWRLHVLRRDVSNSLVVQEFPNPIAPNHYVFVLGLQLVDLNCRCCNHAIPFSYFISNWAAHCQTWYLALQVVNTLRPTVLISSEVEERLHFAPRCHYSFLLFKIIRLMVFSKWLRNVLPRELFDHNSPRISHIDSVELPT